MLAGGTAKPKGFRELFERTLRARRFPIEVAEVRLAADPLTATARGRATSPRCSRSSVRVRLPGHGRIRRRRGSRRGPALAAAREWYDYYLQARDHDIPDKRWADCVKNLQRGAALRPAGTNVQTYGLQFVDYLPTTTSACASTRMEDYDGAIEAFNLRSSRARSRRRRRCTRSS